KDIEGKLRSTSTPDMGALEYTPLNGDFKVSRGSFGKNSLCLYSNDTIWLYVQNSFNDTVDFSLHPLPVHYQVSGPVNTSGKITANTGRLPSGETAKLRITNIDLSIPGTYTLDIWLDSTGVNQMPFNDTL